MWEFNEVGLPLEIILHLSMKVVSLSGYLDNHLIIQLHSTTDISDIGSPNNSLLTKFKGYGLQTHYAERLTCISYN